MIWNDRPMHHEDTTPLVCQGSLFASAGPRLVSWDERPQLQAPWAEPGSPSAGGRQRKEPPVSANWICMHATYSEASKHTSRKRMTRVPVHQSDSVLFFLLEKKGGTFKLHWVVCKAIPNDYQSWPHRYHTAHVLLILHIPECSAGILASIRTGPINTLCSIHVSRSDLILLLALRYPSHNKGKKKALQQIPASCQSSNVTQMNGLKSVCYGGTFGIKMDAGQNNKKGNLSNCITETEWPWDKLAGLTTDGAAAMCVPKSGLVGGVQKKTREENYTGELIVYHYIILQESLCGKALKMEAYDEMLHTPSVCSGVNMKTDFFFSLN